jgi:hypothetical protein
MIANEGPVKTKYWAWKVYNLIHEEEQMGVAVAAMEAGLSTHAGIIEQPIAWVCRTCVQQYEGPATSRPVAITTGQCEWCKAALPTADAATIRAVNRVQRIVQQGLVRLMRLLDRKRIDKQEDSRMERIWTQVVQDRTETRNQLLN